MIDAPGYQLIDGGAAPIKAWIAGVPVEDQALEQLRNVASLPFIHSHVAVMPDVHWGVGATVGSVIATKGAIVPAAVGVDIGCVDRDTEYLSPAGWRRIEEYDGGQIMEYDVADGSGKFVTPEFIKLPCDEFFWFKTKYGINQMLSAEHRVLCWAIRDRNRRREAQVIPAEQLAFEHERRKGRVRDDIQADHRR
jgi:hypothetical protein